MEGRSSGRPFSLLSEPAEDRSARVRDAVPSVRLGEGFDHDPAQPSDGMQHAIAVQHESGVAVPRSLVRIQPDDQIAAPGLSRRHGLTEFRLLVRIARGCAPAGVERLLHKAAAVRAHL